MPVRPISKLNVFLAGVPPSRRAWIAEVLASAPAFHLSGQVDDPLSLLDPKAKSKPDLIILEVGASRVDACILVRRLIDVARAPVVVLSEYATLGSKFVTTLLQAGAIDALPCLPEATPAQFSFSDRLTRSLHILSLVLAASVDAEETASSRPSAPAIAGPVPARPGTSLLLKSPPKNVLANSCFHPRQLIVLGASTGGTEAIKEVLTVLPQEMPGICIVQHIPATFSRSFAQRLNTLCALEVREAEHGDVVRPGLALVAPGGYHMEVLWERSHYVVRLQRGPEEHHQRPAVDVLFRSAASCGGRYVLGVLLTGMGKDGAQGMKAIKESGGTNLAQDDKSCVVFGMPAAAQELGVVHRVVSLNDMAQVMMDQVQPARLTSAA